MTPKVKASISPGGQLGYRTWHLEGPSHAGIKESLTSRFTEGTFIPSSLSLTSLKNQPSSFPFSKNWKFTALGWKWALAGPLRRGSGSPSAISQNGGSAPLDVSTGSIDACVVAESVLVFLPAEEKCCRSAWSNILTVATSQMWLDKSSFQLIKST